MDIKIGSVYQSRMFPHIRRKVIHVKNDLVTYSILDSLYPDRQFNPVDRIPACLFKDISFPEEVSA